MPGSRYLERIEQTMRDVCADDGAELREFNGGAEHLHLILVNFPLTVAISRLVNSLKGVSSRRLRQDFPDLRRHYWRTKRSGRGRTSLGRPAAPQSLSYARTSNSKTVPPDRLTSGRLHHRPESRRTGGHIGSAAGLRRGSCRGRRVR